MRSHRGLSLAPSLQEEDSVPEQSVLRDGTQSNGMPVSTPDSGWNLGEVLTDDKREELARIREERRMKLLQADADFVKSQMPYYPRAKRERE